MAVALHCESIVECDFCPNRGNAVFFCAPPIVNMKSALQVGVCVCVCAGKHTHVHMRIRYDECRRASAKHRNLCAFVALIHFKFRAAECVWVWVCLCVCLRMCAAGSNLLALVLAFVVSTETAH